MAGDAGLLHKQGMWLCNSRTCAPCRSVPKDVLNIEGALYFCTFFLGIVNSLIVQPVVAAERTVFYRERAAHMYSVLPYVLSLVRPFSNSILHM